MRPRAYNAQASSNRSSSGVNRSAAGISGSSIVTLMVYTPCNRESNRVFDRNHRSFVPNFGCYIKADVNGQIKYFAVSRQMVLFAVERRKAWRMLQSKAGVANKD